MSQKKYQIFVSSTFRDLVEERQDAIRNILDLNHIPAGMELFPAADMEQLNYIKKIIDECDYYILIVGGRYGSMDTEGVSYTEREYDYAVEIGKVVLAFVHDDKDAIPTGKSEKDQEAIEALKEFRKKVIEGRLVKMWHKRHELEAAILKALIHAFNNFPQIGWIRGDKAISEGMLEQSNKTLLENAELKEKIKLLEGKNISQDFGDIASLDDKFVINFKRFVRNYFDSYGQYVDDVMELTWREIFMGVAGMLKASDTDDIIVSALEVIAKNKNIDFESDRLNLIYIITIKIQLQALGLIEARISQTDRGGEVELLSLTPKGKKELFREYIVRQPQN